MKIHYVYHSCFLIETSDYYFLFDYYQGSLPVLNKKKPIFVFSSHSHSDHYNPKVFSLLREQEMEQIQAVLSKDISIKKYPKDIPVTKVTHNSTYSLTDTITLETLLSTDEGVAFLLTCPEGTLYHAGDLNDWVWEEESEQYNRQMTGSFRHEIGKLKGRELSVAFLVLDPRQEKDYANGITYFLRHVKVGQVFPMHYWDRPETINKFKKDYPEFAELIQYTEDF